MIRPLAIATDGLLDKRYLPGIATRGYLWAPAGPLQYLQPGALAQAVLVPTPLLELLERISEVYSAAAWAEEPAIYTHFEETPQVSAAFQNANRLLIKYFPEIRVSADWLEDEVEGSD